MNGCKAMFQNGWRLGVCAGVFTACLGSSQRAHARDFEGVVHLSLDGSIVDYQSTSLSAKGQDAGLALTAKTHLTNYGLLGSGTGIGLGVGITDSAFLGAQLSITGTTLSGINSIDQDLLNVLLLPRFEYLFGDDAVRPFVAVMAGVEHSSSKVDTQISGTSFIAGGALGLHAFLTRSFSIDPQFAVFGASGSETLSIDGNIEEPGFSEDFSTSGYRVLLSVGISGWVGGRKPAPAASEAAPTHEEPGPPTEPVGKETATALIKLPHHRQLYLEASADPSASIVIAHLSVPEDDASLASCKKIRVLEGEEPLKFHVAERGDQLRGGSNRHFVFGTLPVHALTVLGRPDAGITVCGETWPFTAKAHHAIHQFLAQRLDNRTTVDEALEPEVTPESDKPATPEAAPQAPTPAPSEGAQGPTPEPAPPTKAAPPSAAFPNTSPAPTAKPTGK